MRERLRSSIRAGASALIAALLLGAPAPASAAANPGKVVFDVMVLRPLGFASLVVGGAFYVPAMLVSLPYGPEGREEAYRVFIEAPKRRTIDRSLGDF